MSDIWDEILTKQGINLTYGRLKYLNLIKKYAVKIYEELSGGEVLDIVYSSNVFDNSDSFNKWADFADKNILYDIYIQKLRAVNSEGQSSKTPGAHRDDILFSINGHNARIYASQGQLRSIAVSLKLAEAEIIRSFNRQNPVVLLDEVLGELDELRRAYVVQHFSDSQVFITSCNVHDFDKLSNMKVWEVNDGIFTSRE
jgi:DNA replication and repair protein RecF